MIYKPRYVYTWTINLKICQEIFQIEHKYSGEKLEIISCYEETEKGAKLNNFGPLTLVVKLIDSYYFYYDSRAEEDLYKLMPEEIKAKVMRYDEYYNLQAIREIVE